MRLRAKTPTCFVTSENGDTLLHILIRESNATDIRKFKNALGKDLIQKMIKITNDEGEIIPDLILNSTALKEEEIAKAIDPIKSALKRELNILQKDRMEIFNILLDDFLQNNLKKTSESIAFEEIVTLYQLKPESRLYELVKHACEVANSIRSKITKSSTHPESNGAHDMVFEIQKNIDEKREAANNRQASIRLTTNDFDSYLANQLKDNLNESIGNCGEHSYCVLGYAKYPVTLCSLTDGDHVFSIFDPSSNPVVCDPWAGRVYPGYATDQQLGAHRAFSYSTNGVTMLVNFINSFNPNYHHIEPINLFGYSLDSIEKVPPNVIFPGPLFHNFFSYSFVSQPIRLFKSELVDGLKRNDISFIAFLLLTSYGRSLLIKYNLINHINENHLTMQLPNGTPVLASLVDDEEGILFLSKSPIFRNIITSKSLNFTASDSTPPAAILLSGIAGRELFEMDEALVNKIDANTINFLLKDGSSVIFVLLAHPRIYTFLRKHPTLISLINETGLNACKAEGESAGISCLSRLMRDHSGIQFLYDHPFLVEKITAEGLNRVMPNGNNKGKTPIHFLLGKAISTKFLFKYPHIVSMMTPESLNSIVTSTDGRLCSPASMLLKNSQGLKILGKYPELISKIDFSLIGKNIGKGSYEVMLFSTPYGQCLLKENPNLIRSAIDKMTSAIYQKFVYWLTYFPEGLELLKSQPELINLIDGNGLNFCAEEETNIGASATFWLLQKPEGCELLYKNAHLRSLLNYDTLIRRLRNCDDASLEDKCAADYLCLPENEALFLLLDKNLQTKLLSYWKDKDIVNNFKLFGLQDTSKKLRSELKNPSDKLGEFSPAEFHATPHSNSKMAN